MTRERIGRIVELREILLSIQTGFSIVNAAVVCAILESISGLEPSLVITEPRYLKLATVSNVWVRLGHAKWGEHVEILSSTPQPPPLSLAFDLISLVTSCHE